MAALREAVPGVEISLSTGLWITGGDVEARHEAVRGWTELPDCVSLNVAEEGWRELGELLAERGIGIEAGLFAPRTPRRSRAAGCARMPAGAGRAAGDRAADGGHHRRRDRRRARARRASPLPQLHHGYDLTTWAVLDAAVRRGRDIRIGFEDTLALPDARRASSNAALVTAAVERYGVRSSG